MPKNIIFDVGEILLGYRWEYVLEVSGLSVEEGKRVRKLIFQDPLWYELDAGNIMLDEARTLYRERYPKEADSIAFFLQHPEMMPIARERVWKLLKDMKAAGYKVYVLSNYGKELFALHVKDAPFWEDVDGAVISYEVHVCKPDARIYETLLEKYGLDPEDCVFYDDRPENIEGAGACGIAGVCIESEEALLAEMERLIEEAG
ncbi:MAG: HAD family phosphatase [Lachnospiraceae bacterium]|nr:HAD family phosphatase [Lachnospiraceae bacterium]